MRHLLFLIFLIPFGCAHTYEMKSTNGDTPEVRLSSEASFFVGVPKDGQYETQVYTGSGLMTTEAIVAAFSEHAENVKAAQAPAAVEENLATAREEQLQYLVQPKILHWEERATEWSGKPDRISVRLDLIATTSEETLDSTVLSGKSKWDTLGGDHPQELLPEPLSWYTNAIFGQ
jgi:hypothetical protein